MAILGPKLKSAYQAGKAIQTPLSAGQMNRYKTMKATDATGANTWAANKLGLTGYNASTAKLSAIQRYKMNQLAATDPNQARLYRQAVLKRNAETATPATPTTPVATGASQTMQALSPKSPDVNVDVNSLVDPSNDALYKWRMQQGESDLAKKMSSLGLTNSSANLQATNDLISQIGAEESKNMWDRAYQQAGLTQNAAGKTGDWAHTNADRLYNILENAATRKTNASNSQWSRAMDIVNAYLSQNPLATAYGASSTQSDLLAKLASSLAAASGGGSESASLPPTLDNSTSAIYGIGATGSNNTDFLNALGSLFGLGQ